MNSARGPDESADMALLHDLTFQRADVRLEPFTEAEQRAGKTPDRRIFEGNALAGYCEVKSPRDDWLDEQFAQAEALPPERRPEIVGGARPDPIFNRLGRQIKSGAAQFKAVDPEATLPHILAIVNHDEMTTFTDLNTTLNGYEVFDGGTVLPTFPGPAEAVRLAAAPMIDLIIFIDAKSRTVRLVENRDRPEMAARARALAGV